MQEPVPVWEGVVSMTATGLFTVTSIRTISGGSLAVMLVVQMIKSWPYVRRIKTQLLSVIVGELLVICTTPLPHTVSGWVILTLNGLLVSSTAIGGWHLVTKNTETSIAGGVTGAKKATGISEPKG